MRGQSQTEDKKRNVLESSVWQQTQGAGSHQTDGTEQREERLTRYLGQRNIDWRPSVVIWCLVMMLSPELSSRVFHYLCDLTIIWAGAGV